MRGKILINNPSDSPRLYVSSVTKDEIEDIKQFVKIYISTQKEYREELVSSFKDKYKINLKNIVAQGSPKKGVTKLVQKYIPHQIIRYDDKGEPIILWRCAAKGGEIKDQANDISTACLVVHEDALSSWNCILSLLNEPDYVIIYKDEN